MQMHARVMPSQSASGEFGIFWAKLQRKMNVKTYEQGFLVLNRLEHFWLSASMENLTPLEACQRWHETVAADDVIERMTGDEIAKLVREYELTYGEIYAMLVDTRSTSIKYYIRGERHPDDPDKPGGLA